MESIQLIKNRIQSISSTRQITQSMRLVSTAKVQKARARMEANRPFREEAAAMLRTAARSMDSRNHPFLRPREGSRAAIVIIGSDRGLCGGYNINVCKEAAALIRSVEQPRIVTVGAKIRDYCRRRYKGKIASSFTGISETPFFGDAGDLAGLLLDWYERDEVDRVYVVHTKFVNMLVQNPTVTPLLPLEPEAGPPDGLTRCEPDPEPMLDRAVPFYLTAFLYGSILESSVCEQSARITSMDSAVKNADEMIANLTLRYNRARQDTITTEIIDIVNGANAV